MGSPRFGYGDRVEFDFTDRDGSGSVLAGTVEVIDNRRFERSLFKGCDWSYDVMSDSTPHPDGTLGRCLHKHIPECDLRRA